LPPSLDGDILCILIPPSKDGGNGNTLVFQKGTPQYMTPLGIPKIGKRDFCPFLRIILEKTATLKPHYFNSLKKIEKWK
jgi:hypothetical protein